MRWRITEPGFEMAGKTGTAQVRKITKEEHESGREEERVACRGSCATTRSSSPSRRSRRRATRAAIVMEHGAVGAHPHVQMVRDILLFAQQRDVLGLRTAYPVSAASADPATSHA